MVVERIPIETAKDLAVAIMEFYGECQRRNYRHSPLHVAVHFGIFSLFKYIAEKIEAINPQMVDGFTAFHFAAEGGHIDICNHMIDKLDDKNPRDNQGYSALDIAAKNGHVKVCELIVDNITEK